jgi:hypothetical protein
LWNANPWYFTGNFLQGLGGNIVFPLNTLIDPGYYLSSLLGNLNSPFVHVVWGLILFVSTFIFSNVIRLALPTAILAAWLVPIQILYPQPFRFYHVAGLIPHISTVISLCLLILSAIIWLNQPKIHWLFIRSLFIITSVLYLLLSNPTNIILIFPLLLTFALFKIKFCASVRDKLCEGLMFLITALFIATIGAVPFIFGLFLNSASVVFSRDFDVDRGYLSFASTMFSGWGLLTVPFAGLGLVRLWKSQGSNQSRWVSLTGLLYGFAILTSGLFNWLYPQFWRLPSPVYFEFFLWPIYCIGAAHLINHLLSTTYRFAKVKLTVLENYQLSRFLNSILLPSSSSLLLVITIVLISFKPPAQRAWLFPPPESPVMNRLVSDLSHKPGDQFKGRVATFTGLNLSGSVNWGDLQGYDHSLLDKVDNDFRKAGFWIRSIPTMTEYNSHITPRFYYFTTQFFLKPGDRQIRSMMTLRSLNKKVLEILGITHVVTDVPNSNLTLLANDPSPRNPILLYGLDSNKSGLSPVNLLYTKNIREAFNVMKSDSFDFKTTATIEKSLDIPIDLVPVIESQILVNGSSYRVTAKSIGQSVLVLPIEYSSCFTAKSNGSGGTLLDLFPTNALLMSVLFERELDINLKYSNGPFENSTCRFHDYVEFKKRL